MNKLSIKELVKQHFNLVEKAKFASVLTKDGELTLEYPGEELVVGSEIFMLGVDGEKMPLADGEYMLETEVKIVVEGGLVKEIMEAEVEAEVEMMEEEVKEEEEVKLYTEEEMEMIKAALIEEMTKIVEELVGALAEEVALMKEAMESPAEEPLKLGKKPIKTESFGASKSIENRGQALKAFFKSQK